MYLVTNKTPIPNRCRQSYEVGMVKLSDISCPCARPNGMC